MVQKYPHGLLAMHKKVTVRRMCPEDDRDGFFDSLAQAFQNSEGFFTCIEEDGTVSHYELSFHDDVLEIEHQASHIAGAIMQPFEPIVFLVESEDDCTVLKQVSFNKMNSRASEVMDDGEKNSNDTPPEHTPHQDASPKELLATQNVQETEIPAMNMGDSANGINVDDLVSLLKHPSAASSSDCPIIVMDEDSLSLAMPGESRSRKDVLEHRSSRSSLQEKRSKAGSESSAGGWSVPSLQVCSSQDGADKPSCESEPCNDRTCISSQTMIDNIVRKASAPQNKVDETDPSRKTTASHDEMYARELMKKKLEEQNALSKDNFVQSESETKPMLVINSYPSEKRSTSSLSSTGDTQVCRSSVTLSERAPRRGATQICPKVEYCKSAEVDSVVIKITVPENSGIEVVLHKINEDDKKSSIEEDRICGSQKIKNEADIQTLRQVIKCTSPHSKATEIITEPPSTSSDTVQTQSSRIMSSIKERNQDLERNTTKGKVKKMVEFFENIRERE